MERTSRAWVPSGSMSHSPPLRAPTADTPWSTTTSATRVAVKAGDSSATTAWSRLVRSAARSARVRASFSVE